MEAQATLAIEASTEYVGRWNRLISTTNWEKGRIILEWRKALEQAGVPAADFSDDAWSRQVGGVSPQHVGRLRRVYERFGQVHDQYAGLYWSHFQAAIDWPDAEMYLEGAVQSGWSVSQMRQQRCEATGDAAESAPFGEDAVNAVFDEDAFGDDDDAPTATISESFGEVHRADARSDEDFDAASFDADRAIAADTAASVADDVATAPLLRPFESLPALPSDVNEAFELFKLAILSHKVSGWRDVARDDVLSVLDALRQLALAPAE